jgi:hypothetical protein
VDVLSPQPAPTMMASERVEEDDDVEITSAEPVPAIHPPVQSATVAAEGEVGDDGEVGDGEGGEDADEEDMVGPMMKSMHGMCEPVEDEDAMHTFAQTRLGSAFMCDTNSGEQDGNATSTRKLSQSSNVMTHYVTQ